MRVYSLFVLLVFLSGCHKTKPPENEKLVSGRKVVILCEGNFMWSNASFDVYYPDSQVLKRDVFKLQNGGKPLGDVLQSATLIGEYVYLVLNNSGKLVMVDSKQFTESKTITGLTSPRYIAKVGTSIWVTDLYSATISVFNENTLHAKIPTGSWTEQLLVTENNVAVACYTGFVKWYDTATLKIIDSTLTPRGAQWMTTDKNKQIWVLCTDSGRSTLLKMNPISRKITLSLKFPMGEAATRLIISKNKDSLFFLSQGAKAMSINDVNLPKTPFYSKAGSNFYGIGTDPVSGKIYISDAKDYVSKGQVYIVDSKGNFIKEFSTGIIPSDFLFYQDP